jgi:hypothetical protein
MNRLNHSNSAAKECAEAYALRESGFTFKQIATLQKSTERIVRNRIETWRKKIKGMDRKPTADELIALKLYT